MKDIKIDNDTKSFVFVNNDLTYINGNDELAQSIWAMLNTNLNNLIPQNGNIMLGNRFNEEYVTDIINNLLINFDPRISTTRIEKISFSDVDRTMKINLTIFTNDGDSVTIGGSLNA